MPYKDRRNQLEWNRKNSFKWKASSRLSAKKCKAQVSAAIKAIKSSACCVSCGVTDPDVLHAHHLDPSRKRFELSRPGGRSLRQVVDELQKCVWLCANCHAKATIEQRRDVNSGDKARANARVACEILDCYLKERGRP